MKKDVEIFEDRAEAIQYAIQSASYQDVILIAGKGHESYQSINGSKITLIEQETHPRTGMKMRKAIIVDTKGKENTIVKDPYGKEHLLPEKPTSKINTSLHSIRNIKAILIE